ncbi:indolepyruvate ferredoxin oxidoreductase family protein [Roseomonas stagni]|uniref:Indolepyruvate ferredoxin oxidoreductase family protein n=1 Tax=Falsiroseomonas algicola TaxID=2716930 RepID=A0A6M1LIV0_9PROT|nr:indolepyruvate ferredoxin oxidoreductase family protein [Falsiroseomonas algicola]NGM20107.1 indolepyruvate ferredoxin oxidoreductase family protein [Falsiroseomonas algicola]
MGSLQRPEASLDDKWDLAGEPVVLNGIQALVRLPLLRRQLDQALGWNTAGYISGYRGSPIGGYDKELEKQAARLAAADIVFNPGLNEDLAATAVWGTQQVPLSAGARHEGVFGIWYGKGPGLDRSGDALRHANSAGTSPKGGVLALSGDDPSAKSSTVSSGCEFTFQDLEIPMLDPAEVAEVLEYGVKGIALSRFAGTWVGLKCIAETMDAAATLRVDPGAYVTQAPNGVVLPPGGLHLRVPDPSALEQESRLRLFKLPAAVAFARANGIDRLVIDPPAARFGIVVRGKAFAALRQALADAGITPEIARRGGLRVWKVGLAWPLDAEAARAFAEGLEEVLVVEDRRAFLEPQLKTALYALERRPRILGKQDERGAPLLSELAELDTAQILRALAARLPADLRTEALAARIAELDAQAAAAAEPLVIREPTFCPGCPHNTSTRLPEGSRAMAGIGCHWLTTKMPERRSQPFTHMGGEGATWLGIAPFTEEPHVFANIGDGTFSHSGSLALRAAVAAKANITYKVLVNSAVAMTGGQAVEGAPGVPRIAAQIRAEGVQRIAVVADDPDRHKDDPEMPAGITYHHRSTLDAVQRELRAVPGVTALIYDQECATERRRKRKRGTAAAAERRAVINPRVCEDCGECSRVSNCIAVEPLETPWGRKRKIEQSACNQDLSCVQGFCPSFVTLLGAEPSKPKTPARPGEALPDPVLPQPVDGRAWNVMVAGVGGQGVTALGAILGMAAHIDGRPSRSVDTLGFAQKGGGVYVQLRIGQPGTDEATIPAPRIGAGQADLLIASDMVVAHGRNARPLLGAKRTAAIVNAELAPTAQFVRDTTTRYDDTGMMASLAAVTRELHAVNAATEVTEAFGDAIYLNIWLLGLAFQRGLVPVSSVAIEQAIRLNGAQIERNLAAFALGRQAAIEGRHATPRMPETLEALIARRVADLTDYQDARYAQRYADFIATVRSAEQAALPGQDRLSRAVATQLYRLMAFKDEYEVARLHSLPAWQTQLSTQFTGTQRVEMHLSPPLLSKLDPNTGLPAKRAFGPWMLKAMGLLRHGKRLRFTPLDPFGRTEERRMERALIEEYRDAIQGFLARLSPATHGAICDWAEAAAGIKGFGPIKARNVEKTRRAWADIAARIDATAATAAAA